MKNVFLFLLLITFINSLAQELPIDSIILKEVFGKIDRNSMTYTRPFYEEKGEGINTYEDSIIWKVVFKDKVNLQSQDLVFAIIEAEDFTQHGHQFGYRNMYFFKQVSRKIELIDSIIFEGEIWLGDNSTFEITDIGKNKKALIVQFGSTGNQHFEGSQSINLLEIGKLTYLLSAESYNNSAWKIPESENEDCEARGYDEKFEIIKRDNEWYDIKIQHIDYGFTSGCKDSFIKLETEKTYIYTDGNYKEKVNN